MTWKDRKAQLDAANKRRADRAAAAVKIEKLERLANDAGAFHAEAENARHKANVLKEKAAALKSPFDPPPLPGTVEELLARRKKTRNPATARQADAKRHDNENDNATKLENAKLRARVAELEGQLARANKTITKSNGRGRLCKGDRPMTGYERLKAWRERQRAN